MLLWYAVELIFTRVDCCSELQNHAENASKLSNILKKLDKALNTITTDNSRNASSTGTITEPSKHEGPQDISGPSSCSEQSLLRGQPRLLRVSSSLVSKSSKGRDYMSSQGNLLRRLVLLRVRFPHT